MLMVFAFQMNTEKGYILLGNYLLDHPRHSLNPTFDFFKDKFSDKSNFAWIVRLVLDA